MGAWLILGSALGFGLNPLLAQFLVAAGFSPEVVTLYRFIFPALVSIPFLLSVWRIKETYYILALGAFCGLSLAAYFHSLTLLPTSTAILIYYTYPLFVIMLGALFFKQTLTRNRLVSACIIVVAASLFLNPQEWQGSLLIIGLCFLAPISYAVLVNCLARRESALTAAQKVGTSAIGALVILFPVSMLMPQQQWFPQSIDTTILLLAIGLFAAVIPQWLFALGALLTGSEKAAFISSLEVIFALGFVAVFIGEHVGHLDIIACLLFILASLIRLESNEKLAVDLTDSTAEDDKPADETLLHRQPEN